MNFSLALPIPKQPAARQSLAPISSSRLTVETSLSDISSDSADPFSELNVDFQRVPGLGYDAADP